jgi:hypothetical protein
LYCENKACSGAFGIIIYQALMLLKFTLCVVRDFKKELRKIIKYGKALP